MSQGFDLEAFAARSVLSDVVVAYATALHARDWIAYRDTFEDRIEVDYNSLGAARAVHAARDPR